VTALAALTALAAAELVLIGVLVRDRYRAHPDLEPLLNTIQSLCQRLQAPGTAVLEHDERVRVQPPEGYAPPAIEPDDDEAYWLSREALAEGAMKYETEHVGHDGS